VFGFFDLLDCSYAHNSELFPLICSVINFILIC